MLNRKISEIDEFKEVVEAKGKFLLIKHSLTCPISHAAFEEFEKFVEDNQAVDTYYLYVQEARPLSNYIAETYHVKHESPQAILFDKGDVTWHASHWKITYDSLTREVVK
ncbi:bacillithiol system redox-active protein YtxJ [Bacillus timonensis]|nr:bacillithiol system redox-active protein YtxJ [Bacillus timonensis]